MSSFAVARTAAGARDIWTGVALAAMPIGTLAQTQIGAPAPGLDAGDALCLLACLACAWGASQERQPLSAAVQAALVCSCAFWFASEPRVAFLALTAAALVVLAGQPRGAARRSAWLWLALSTHGLWGFVALRIASPLIVPAETRLAGWAARAAGFEAGVAGTRIDGAGGWYIYVAEGCSSLHGMSLDLLIWASSLSLMGIAAGRRHAAAFAASVAGLIVLNTVRILLMARSEDAYRYWHDGGGATRFGFALTALAVLSVAAATRPRVPCAA